VEDQPLERLTALRHYQQAVSLAAGDEGLFHRMPAGDEFLVLTQKTGGRRSDRRSRPAGLGRGAGSEWATVRETAGAGPVVGTARRTGRRRSGRGDLPDRLGEVGRCEAFGLRREFVEVARGLMLRAMRGGIGAAFAEAEAGALRTGTRRT
jgi:hypothetical protein